MHRFLRGIFTDYPEGSRAIDWGAGTGDLTSLMLEHFGHVYAVAASPFAGGARRTLSRRPHP
jgi:ubiquinone/menaquinone biosynthesis C-methylase UbiE